MMSSQERIERAPSRDHAMWRSWMVLVCLLPCLCHCQSAHRQTKGHTKGFRPYVANVGVKKSALHAASKPRRIALLIGINRYQDRAWHPLRFAAKDARDMASALRDKALGRFDKILLYTTPAKTTRAAINAAFGMLHREAGRTQDTVFIYISGHGTLARDSQHLLRRYLVAYDTIAAKASQTGLAVRALRERFARLPSERKVLLLATCHSGAGKSRLNRHMKAELQTMKGAFFVKPLERVSRASFVLGVCSFGETAQESPKLKNDIYTHYFIKAIRQRYDANSDGAVTLTEAHDYAKEMTYFHTKGKQRAYAESDILGTDPIVLVGKKKRRGKPVLYAYQERFRGVHVHVNGTAKGSFPRGVTVGNGRQKIKLVSHDNKLVLFEGDVEFKAGERIDAQRLFRRRFFPFSIAFKSGYQMFLQGSSGDSFSRSLPLFGVEFKLQRPLKMPFDFRFEFAFSYNSHQLTEQENRPQTVTELNFALAVTYSFRWRWFSLYLGPRLSAIYLHRQSDLHPDVQDFFYSFQPGVLLGTEFRLSGRWGFFIESRLNYTYVTVENAPPQHQGSLEFLGGINVQF